jgi:hypothetical protein
MKKSLPQKTKNITVNDLAIMVANGFTDMQKQISELDLKIDGVEERLTSRIDGLERRIDDFSLTKANKSDVVKLDIRMTHIEKGAGAKK